LGRFICFTNRGGIQSGGLGYSFFLETIREVSGNFQEDSPKEREDYGETLALVIEEIVPVLVKTTKTTMILI